MGQELAYVFEQDVSEDFGMMGSCVPYLRSGCLRRTGFICIIPAARIWRQNYAYLLIIFVIRRYCRLNGAITVTALFAPVVAIQTGRRCGDSRFSSAHSPKSINWRRRLEQNGRKGLISPDDRFTTKVGRFTTVVRHFYSLATGQFRNPEQLGARPFHYPAGIKRMAKRLLWPGNLRLKL